MLIAGPLADKFFEPNMSEQGSLAAIFGGVVGTGSGAGMALMMVIAGALGIAVSLGAYSFKTIRHAEDILPDHDAKTMQQT